MSTITRTRLLATVLLAGLALAGSAAGDANAADRPAQRGDVVLDDFTPPRPARRTGELATAPSTNDGVDDRHGAADDVASAPAPDAAGPSGPDDLKGGPGCSIQCITSGVAYARGVGAELVVHTDTSARIWIIVWNDDGYHEIADSGGLTQSFSLLLDDLDPGSTYSAMASAEDGAGYASNADGSFTTLERNVEITFGPANVYEAPFTSDDFGVNFWANGAWIDEDIGTVEIDGTTLDHGLPPVELHDVDRHLDLAMRVSQSDDAPDICEAVPIEPEPTSGQVECTTWASALLEDGDLDDRPESATSWTQHTLQRTLVLPGGNALPGGYGSPLQFNVPVTLHVTYS